MTATRQLTITQPAAKALSPAQKKFNSLVKRIAAQRERLALWQQAVALYREQRAHKFTPLLLEFRALSVQLVRGLHAAFDRKGLTKTERATVSELITDRAGPLTESAADEAQREEMKKIYNQHAEVDFDTEQAEDEAMARDLARDMATELFGIDLPEDLDLDSPEDLMRHVGEQMQAKQAEVEARQAPRAAKKPSKREQKEAEQAREASQTVREVYRKLASQLHPDREPDPDERARKTALMQRVNDAYAQNRLLDLLQLQLEAEQIDPTHMANLGALRLKHYNRVLGEQLGELEEEIMDTEMAFRMEFGVDLMGRLRPERLTELLRADVSQITFDLHHLRRDISVLDELPAFKRWLKVQRQALRAAEKDDDFAIPF